ncbi:MAG: hypothetical protein FJX33_09960 [Alphaproteobacteria bacterium]|nr:hypothetical protein [Alphaproteobacteria bacterium]
MKQAQATDDGFEFPRQFTRHDANLELPFPGTKDLVANSDLDQMNSGCPTDPLYHTSIVHPNRDSAIPNKSCGVSVAGPEVMKGVLTEKNAPRRDTFQQLQRRRSRDIFGQYNKVIGTKWRTIMAMPRVGCQAGRAPVTLPDHRIHPMAHQHAGGLVDHLLTARNNIAAKWARKNNTRHAERTFAKTSKHYSED